jgi:RecA-family ATPase
MSPENEAAAVPHASVGADAGQPLSSITGQSISDKKSEINTEDEETEKDLQAKLLKMRQFNDPAYLPTVTMQELYENVYHSRPPLIDGLLYAGTYLFAGAPKVGKSFFMAQLAYHISTGQKLWEYEVHQGTVLYLALEDGYQRLQERMFRMFGVEGTDKLHFAVFAKQLGNGLDEQLEKFMREHQNTKLVIIDTLQKIRELGGEAYSYADDYQIVGRLKQFADKYGICLILVHHTRKTPSGDKFEMISGTTGLLGCADGAFVLQKENRTDSAAVLDVVGRDQPDQKLYLIRDEERLIWDFDHAEKDLWKEPPDPLIKAVAGMLTADAPTWQGSATELIDALHLEIQPNALSKRLNIRAGNLLNDFGVKYENSHGRSGSVITLTLTEPKA